jgi:hypothetical protein
MRTGRRRAVPLLLASALCGALFGCAEAVGPKTQETVAAALRAANDEENRRQLEAFLRSDAVQGSLQALARSAVDAAYDDLTAPERQAKARELAADFVRALGPAVGETLGKDVLPRVRAELTTGVEAALDSAFEKAFGPGGQERAGDFAAAVAGRAMAKVAPAVERSIADGLAAGVERSLRAVLAHDLAPAVAAALDSPALARAARAGTAASLAGVADAMSGPFGEALRRERQASIDASVAAATAAAERERRAWLGEIRGWIRLFLAVAAATGLVLLGAGILLWRLLLDNRRLRAGG